MLDNICDLHICYTVITRVQQFQKHSKHKPFVLPQNLSDDDSYDNTTHGVVISARFLI